MPLRLSEVEFGADADVQADFVAVLFVEAVPDVHFDRADRRLPVHARARADAHFEVVHEGIAAIQCGAFHVSTGGIA